jgi:murein DD-endopeptidase MepM/ murein hydrolase activator NlpD
MGRRSGTFVLVIVTLLCAAAPAAAREAVEPLLAPDAVFPVQGRTHFGDATTYFGGGRGHRGQDVFAGCGTPMVVAAAGTVLEAKRDGAAGNYVVVETAEHRSHVYMHLRLPARVQAGDRVEAGQTLGSVGDTGNAWDCHLHFEVWTAPGWYRGGHPIDPLPFLKSLSP